MTAPRAEAGHFGREVELFTVFSPPPGGQLLGSSVLHQDQELRPGTPGYPSAMPGPYITMATFCEKVLQEADGVLSVIRIIERVTLQANAAGAPAELPEGGSSLPRWLSP